MDMWGKYRCFSKSAWRKRLWPKVQRRGEQRNLGKHGEPRLALVNIFFNKKEDHLITCKSGGTSSQTDFIMTRIADLKTMRECKVTSGEEVVSQHRLLCAVPRTKEAKHRRRTIEKRIKIWTLKGEKVTKYRYKVEEEY